MKQQHVNEEKIRLQLDTLIGEQVLHILGQPELLQRVQVRHLWDDHFRVNVLVGVDATSAKIAHSYFLMVGDHGNIITSAPKITKLY
jgi:hypothetical protein